MNDIYDIAIIEGGSAGLSAATYRKYPRKTVAVISCGVDRTMRTNIQGLYACGDNTGRPYQVSKAVGEGLIASLSVAEYLHEQENKAEA